MREGRCVGTQETYEVFDEGEVLVEVRAQVGVQLHRDYAKEEDGEERGADDGA